MSLDPISRRRSRPRALSAPLVALAALAGVSSCATPERAPPSTSESSMPSDESKTSTSAGAPALSYPSAPRGDVVDVLHGVEVPDPWRWLEDPATDAAKAWVDAQNRLAEGWLAEVAARPAIRARLSELWDYDKQGLPHREGDRVFFSRREGLQDQPVLWVRDGDAGEPRVLLDPNELSEDGTVSLSAFEPSRDGGTLAYSLSTGGSDWREIRFRDVTTGDDLPDVLRWVKFSGISWDAAGDGIYYSRYDAPGEGHELEEVNESQKLCYHALGASQDDDIVVCERPEKPKWGFSGEVTHDGRYLVIEVWEGTARENAVFYRDLRQRDETVELLDRFDAAWRFVGNVGARFIFFTDLDAPRGRLVSVDVAAETPAPVELVAESEATLESTSLIGGRLVSRYLRDAQSWCVIRDLDGSNETPIALPSTGTVAGLRGQPDEPIFHYAFTSFTYPTTILACDVRTGESHVDWAPDVEFEPADYETRQVFYESADGTRVPMFIVHRRGLELDGARPTYLYGYGGFNISLTPSFSVPNLVWLEMGGVFAMPNLRGGGEYGEAWHEAGMKTKKQNVFDDFIAAAEWLIEEGYTSSDKLAIGGRSNGGLLVGACMTQRPDLFAATLPGVGVLDMLRFHKFTIGWAWVSDYGSPDDPEEFRALHAYSPYHNVRAGTAYPATLVTTADHDDRVVPAHSYKFTAALQAAQGGPAPILARIDTKAGHGAGKSTSQLIEEWTDAWSFLARALDMSLPPSFSASSPPR